MPGAVPFMEALESPVIVANIDDTDEPTFQGKYQKYVVIDRYDRKIGIIGIILSTVNVRIGLIAFISAKSLLSTSHEWTIERSANRQSMMIDF